MNLPGENLGITLKTNKWELLERNSMQQNDIYNIPLPRGPGVRFSNVFVNLRIEYNACKNLRIATIFVILELHLIRIV
jgi:hypothetical protein